MLGQLKEIWKLVCISNVMAMKDAGGGLSRADAALLAMSLLLKQFVGLEESTLF